MLRGCVSRNFVVVVHRVQSQDASHTSTTRRTFPELTKVTQLENILGADEKVLRLDIWKSSSPQRHCGYSYIAQSVLGNMNTGSGMEGNWFTSVHNLIFMTPVDSFDELVDVAANFVRRRPSGKLLQELQHVLQGTTNLENPSGYKVNQAVYMWRCSVSQRMITVGDSLFRAPFLF